ncbi:uncharacterized protein LY89DRAFT_688149 [Mollisia scopiformis]|uniref:Uncharacterized protein n=1 Tax=Mollisia scopiformis TaxID=149040 RepID=A0A194WXY6_MOLSC|nr:uncharacterized protein LY89DRAFT_688149 [Mollisia scopiformis]KUJ12462.1 hypothetical protein LY89DRAFT_688149 [Mollisia scopiformis]
MVSQQTNTVSWQSAFLGLVPLALNAMTQPSTLDAKLPESSILFAARSSPFVCVADAVEVLIELCIHTYQRRKLREAAKLVNWRRARFRLGVELSSLEESAAEKHPRSFLIFFIATLLQAVKILGLEGLFWTKVWAGCYICSYVVLAGLQFLAPGGWRDDPPPRNATGDTSSTGGNTITSVVQLVWMRFALGVHIWVASGALYHVVYAPIARLSRTSSLGYGLSLLIGLIPAVSIASSGILLLWAMLDFFFQLLEHVRPRPPAFERMLSILRDLGSGKLLNIRWTVIFFAWFSILVGQLIKFFGWARYGEENVSSLGYGGGFLMLCCGVLLFFLHISSTVLKRVHSLRWLMPEPDVPRMVLVFPFLNFLVAFLYYRFAYDPHGTYKPAWTENLG